MKFMTNLDKIVKSAFTTFVALSTLGICLSANAAETKAKQTDSNNMEKCYGITKAGMNDCQTATASCASSSTKDKQADAFIFLPKGTCDRIVGGKLNSPSTKK
jgi:uncharacterized membrane protein